MEATKSPKNRHETRGGKRAGAGRPPADPASVRGERFALRLTAKEVRVLEIRAKGAGMSVADYARLVLVGP
jgi:hypothetical protein